ncbi:MAG: NAD-dependent epimerase [Bacteroidales bacterium]|nr:NAD-dependent epimerase [Bacteroidales bacterium]
MKILVTGSAGFIGYHLVNRLLAEGHEVTGLDSINDYYDVSLKYARLADAGISRDNIVYNTYVVSTKNIAYRFIQMNLEDEENISRLFKSEKFDRVCNLAAQAGVRYSLKNPRAYINSNIIGFLNILEGCRHSQVPHLVYASSSSVYGLNEKMPFSVKDNVDHPVSLYAASKKSNELMAHTYSSLFGLATTGLRFFTVYGPWGRPDMALFIFTKAILGGNPIEVYNNGKMERDFTYIDDIVEGVYRIILSLPKGNGNWSGLQPDPSCSRAPYRLYNIGNNNPVKLMDFIEAIEKATGRKAQKTMMPIQPGDVVKTWADVDALIQDFNYKPNTSVTEGIRKFVEWYRGYFSVK